MDKSDEPMRRPSREVACNTDIADWSLADSACNTEHRMFADCAAETDFGADIDFESISNGQLQRNYHRVSIVTAAVQASTVTRDADCNTMYTSTTAAAALVKPAVADATRETDDAERIHPTTSTFATFVPRHWTGATRRTIRLDR